MTTGRPKSSSRETLAEAACELFLERGYAATAVSDIASRAGVSRSSFFNYFGSKADILWAGLDERIGALEATINGDVRTAVLDACAGFAPDSLALALVNAEAMGLGEELEREAAWRRARIGALVATQLRGDGIDAVTADVAAAAFGGAVLGAVAEWARQGAGRADLASILGVALDRADAVVAGARS